MIYYTYAHHKPDGSIFYIGKGRDARAYAKTGRSIHWNNTAKKYKDFTVTILAKWPTEKEAFEHEIFLIETFKLMSVSIVNLSKGGEGASGVVPSAETRKKMSVASKGRRKSEETKAKMSAAAKGVKKSTEHLEKMRQQNLGKKANEKQLAALTAHRHLAYTPEAQANKSAALKGRDVSSWIHKVADANRGKKASVEARANMSAAGKGRKQSAEQIAKRMISRLATLKAKKELKNA